MTGVALTKLDGSAKGGVAVAIAHELGLPVKLVGVGERLDDLRPFDAGDFAQALLAGSAAPPGSPAKRPSRSAGPPPSRYSVTRSIRNETRTCARHSLRPSPRRPTRRRRRR